MPVTREDLLYALMAVQRARMCWCEHGIGNPQMTTHSAACQNAREICQKYNRPDPPPGDEKSS